MENERLNGLLDKARTEVKEINVDELKKKMMMNKVTLIDVREDKEWDKGHIPGAIHISKGLLECKIEKIIPETQTDIILHCAGGTRSLIAAYNLKQMGYSSPISLIGGFGDWVNAGGEVVVD